MADISPLFRDLINLDELGALVYIREHLRPPLNKRLAEIIVSNLWDSLGHEPLCGYEIDFAQYEDALLLCMESDLEFIIRKAKPVVFLADQTSLKRFFVSLLYLVQEERKRRRVSVE
jgi:hypothetical protein